jgi:hypothetical protein
MVSNIGLLHIHQRLKEIFVTPNIELFAGISVLVFGDFFQLPPIRSATTLSNYKNDTFNLHHPWHVFKMAELTQIMIQKDDLAFTQLLGNLSTDVFPANGNVTARGNLGISMPFPREFQNIKQKLTQHRRLIFCLHFEKSEKFVLFFLRKVF